MVRGNRGCRASRFVVLGWVGERVLDGIGAGSKTGLTIRILNTIVIFSSKW